MHIESDPKRSGIPAFRQELNTEELILNIAAVQPKLHKRMTTNVKKRQLAYILAITAKLFDKQ